MLRAIIVDDEELSVKRLVKILSASGEIEICQTFMNPFEAYEFAKANPIHVAFLDIFMPEINGMRLSGLLHDLDPEIDVVFVTAYDDYAVQAFDMDALDYLMKPVTVERMSKTLDKIRRRRPRPDTPEKKLPGMERLTEQEKRILLQIANGLSNKEIGDRLNIASETVKYHLKNVYRKLGVNNRVQALQSAQALKLQV